MALADQESRPKWRLGRECLVNFMVEEKLNKEKVEKVIEHKLFNLSFYLKLSILARKTRMDWFAFKASISGLGTSLFSFVKNYE